ncbi:MAG: TonB-dependent receptor [Bacteroidota bacterium]
MLRRLLSVIILLSLSFFAMAQRGKISGKVSNNRNEALPGVSIKILEAAGGVQTGVDGTYVISLEAGKKLQLVFSFVGYEAKTIEVEVKPNEDQNLDVLLELANNKSTDVVVKGQARTGRQETVSALIQYQKNTNTVASVVSAEAIRRSPDRNSGDVLKRVPGTSVQEGKYLVVRGLADRYNQAMLNGILLPSTEADRKTFSFDLIPANMIDNMIINKAFVPEHPGEWAGGLVQVNTRDIPTKNFFSLQIGTGFNTQTIANDFYTYKGGKTDWLGFDDGSRSLPSSYTTKNQFALLTPAEKNEIGKQMENVWSAEKGGSPINASFQASGGFVKKFSGNRQLGVIIGLTYNKTNRYTKLTNNGYSFSGSNTVTPDFLYNDDKYAQDVLAGALGTITYQFNSNNKISYKTIFNINTSDYATLRSGLLNNGRSPFDSLRGTELALKQNMFWNNQLSGEHNFPSAQIKARWYGSFNVLDAYVPDQRRLLYLKDNTNANSAFAAQITNTLSQQSGNRFYQFLNDYVYTAGGDLTKTFNLFNQKQSIKGGYLFQVRDRLFDSKPFSVYLPRDNAQYRSLPSSQIFAAGNFGDGSTASTQFAFDAIGGNIYRYLANNILNAGFIQFDNQFTSKFRLVWGLRVENFDQLLGSVKQWDPRHSHTEVTDYLPGINATYKLNAKTNIRVSASQTVVRPELRELATFQFFDFDLNATVQGSPGLKRTKITNADVRYELYPKAGEVFNIGVFYKYFDKPIEQTFNLGGGGSSTFNYSNPEKATAYGIELEYRKKLDFNEVTKNFTFLTNLSYIKSKVADSKLALDRPLQGQSNYLVNAGLLYDLESAGFNATFLYNQVGERIAFVGTGSAGGSSDFPDIWESSRPVLDFQVTQKIMQKKGEIRLGVSDILNKKLYFYQNTDGNTKLNKGVDTYRFTRQFGTTFSLTFGYNF